MPTYRIWYTDKSKAEQEAASLQGLRPAFDEEGELKQIKRVKRTG